MAFTIRSPVRWWLTGLCVVGVVLAGLVLALALVLRAYAPTLSRDRLETALTEALGRPVRIEGVTLSAWRRRIEIRDLRVDPGPGEGAEPLLRLDRGEVRIGLGSLWRRQVVLSRILLQGVTLRAFGSGQGSSPPLVVPDTVQFGPVTVRIVTVQIERGRVVYRDETRGLTVDAQNLNVTARPVQGGIDASLRLAALAIEMPHLRETITEVEGSGWIHQDRLTLRQLAGRWQERPLRVTGDVRDPFAVAAFDLRVQGEVDLAPLARHLDAPSPLAGMATVAVDIRGRSDALEISGRVSVPRLTAAFIHARDVAARGKWSHAELALQLQGDVDLAPIGRDLKSPWPVGGVARVAADVQGRPDTPEISGSLTVSRLTVAAAQAQDVAVRAQWRRGVLDLPQITARIFGGTLRGSVKTTPDRLAETRATLVLRQASLASLDGLASAPTGLRGEVDVDAEVEGDPRRLQDIKGRFHVTATGIVPPGDLSRIGPGTLTATGTLHDAIASITQGSGRWTGLQIETSGHLGQEGPMGLRLVLHADLGHVAPLWGVEEVAGRATLQGEANGHWTAPEFTGEVRAAPVTLAGVQLDSLQASLQLRGTNLVVPSATAALGQSKANASGTVTWSDPGDATGTQALRRVQFRADIQAATVQWDDVRQWLPKDAQGTGTFALAGRVAGTPGAWRADGTIEARALTTHDVPLQDLQGAFSVTPDRVEVPRLRARAHGIPVRGTGTWRWEGAGQATAEVGPVDLAGVPGVPPTLDLRGTGQAHVQMAVRDGTVEGSGTAALDRVAVGDIALGNGSGQLAIREGQIHVTLALPERRLSATARGALDGDRPLSVRLDAREVQLAPLVARIERLRELNVDGKLTAVAEFLVPRSQPSTARGALTLDAVRLLVAGEEWTNREPIALRWEPNVLTVERLRLASRLGDLTVSGQVDPWAAINLQVDGRFPLGILPAFRPEIREAAGTLKIVAQIGGTTAAPQPVGEATIQGGTLQLRDRPETLREIEARVLLSPAGLRLVEATASLGRGRIRASGDLTLSGWQPDAYRITVAGTNVSIEPLQGFQSAWDLDLELVGQGPRVLLRGEGRLLQGRYTGKLNLVAMLLDRRSEPPADAAPGIPLHVLLKLNNNLRIDTNWARMQAGGTLNLEGTTTQPILLGSLEAQEGRITFRKHRWTVTSAAVRFADPRRIDPILDVTGRAIIQQYDVTLQVSGRLNELVFRFSSVPPLKQQELLSLVTVGATNATAGAALGEVGQLLAEDVLGLATGGYAPETFGMEKTEKNEQVFNVGKQVTEDVRVLYTQTLSGASKRVLRIEYQVIGPLLLAAEQDFQGGVGGDVLVRLRFR